MSQVPESPSESEIESAVAQRVHVALDAKIAEYRKILYAFFLGLGLFVLLITGNYLISNQSLLVMVHDTIFGSSQDLDDALRNSVAVSYSNHFWMSDSDGVEQSIAFYAAESQTVVASIEIKHTGIGASYRVIASLDDIRIFTEREDYTDELTLNHFIEESRFERPNKVRRLIFSIDDEGESTEDRVLVRVLINVRGLEEEGQ